MLPFFSGRPKIEDSKVVLFYQTNFPLSNKFFNFGDKSVDNFPNALQLLKRFGLVSFRASEQSGQGRQIRETVLVTSHSYDSAPVSRLFFSKSGARLMESA